MKPSATAADITTRTQPRQCRLHKPGLYRVYVSKVSLSIRPLSTASLGGVHTATDADGDAGRREGVWRSGVGWGEEGNGGRKGCCRDASFVVVVFVLSVFFAAF